jgi:hypothetical protein
MSLANVTGSERFCVCAGTVANVASRTTADVPIAD